MSERQALRQIRKQLRELTDVLACDGAMADLGRRIDRVLAGLKRARVGGDHELAEDLHRVLVLLLYAQTSMQLERVKRGQTTGMQLVEGRSEIELPGEPAQPEHN